MFTIQGLSPPRAASLLQAACTVFPSAWQLLASGQVHRTGRSSWSSVHPTGKLESTFGGLAVQAVLQGMPGCC